MHGKTSISLDTQLSPHHHRGIHHIAAPFLYTLSREASRQLSMTYLQHMQQRRLARIIESEEQELRMLI